MIRGLDRGRVLSAAALAFLAIAVLAVGFTLCRRAIVISDEGYLLLEAQELLQGKVIYKDLDSFVAPGVWFLLATLFAVFRPSVLISRAPALACYIASAFFIHRIVRRVCGPRYAYAAVVAYLVLTVWTFPAWTFSFYSPYSVLFALAALERTLAWGRSGSRVDALLVGFALGLSIIFKQNFGVLATMGAAIGALAFAIQRRSATAGATRTTLGALGWATAGALLTALPVVAYLVSNSALDDAFNALVVAPFSEFATQHTIPYLGPRELVHNTLLVGTRRLIYGAYALSNTNFLLTSSPSTVSLVAKLHVVLYLAPPMLLAVACALALVRGGLDRKVDADLIAVSAVSGFVYLGVFPRADFNHLAHVYQPLLVLAAVVTERVARVAGARASVLAVVVPTLTVLAVFPFAAVAADWYARLLASHDSRIVHERGGVLLDPYTAQMIDFEVEAIRERTLDGETLLTLPGIAMLNFVADRPMPSRYVNLYAVHVGHDGGAGVAQGAELAGTQWVVAEYNNFFSDAAGLRDYAPRLAEYVRSTFEPAFSVAIDKHMFMRRRREPLPPSDPVDVHTRCDAGTDPFASRSVRSHLLFDSIYHRVAAQALKGGREITDTTCDLTIPEHATLYALLGYRQPLEARPGSGVIVRIWMLSQSAVRSGEIVLPDDLDRGAIAPIYQRRIEVEAAKDWATPGPVEIRADLSAVGGRDVLLVLRSEFEGEAAMNPYDVQGFAVTWNDLRVERRHVRAEAN